MAWLWDNGKRKVNFADAVQPYLNQLQTSFQNNVNTIYNKLVLLGSTPSAKTPAAITNAIQAINDSIYNKLVSLGQTPAGKTVANLNAKIQALTEIQWAQVLNIDKVSYQDSGETKYLNTRDVPFNCRDLVDITIAFNYIYTVIMGTDTGSFGTITWYNASGTVVGTSRLDVTASGTGSANYSQKFTPSSGAVRGTLHLIWAVFGTGTFTIRNTPTATFKYQTKVLR